MFIQARTEAEPEFVAILKKLGFAKVRQGTKRDDVNHIDVFGTKDGIEWHFDVKDLSEKYLHLKNYNMSNDFKLAVTRHPENFKRHIVACRLYSNGKPTGKYACFKTLEAVKHAKQFHRKDDPTKTFWLFNIDDCMKNIPNNMWKIIC